ncbi:Ku protein [Amycolatopsis sp. YIM 10]|uniref:non-homologous end joining protein Ku n=1 Tax=Amycolatopsis sp. YIM 10 TaxID=2653857 RepID=UPI00128FEEB1|nr:Ku protein [Amycolatopsis sp. YIM 10]QFU85520.1 putative DNA repair protein YkoV [Amycolatopsis sp. YIM 10]
MARPIWSGAVNFGLVTVPVELYSATEDHTVHFRQFERGTSDRIRYRRVNERTGKEVDYSDIVKGYELDDGDYVLIEPEELDEIAPGRSRALDIEAFVDLDEIDPAYFQKTYWLVPSKEEFERAYTLLLAAMDKTNKAAISKFVMRGKEYLAAVRAGDGVLVLNTLHFPADLRDPAKELRKLPAKQKPRGKELDMAVALVDSMSEPWKPKNYQDTYTARVEKLVRDKKAGRTVTPEEEPAQATQVVDLFEALAKSVKGRKPSTASTDLSSLSKADLDKMARDLDIKGRSKLSRAELEKAVKKASSSSGKQKKAS